MIFLHTLLEIYNMRNIIYVHNLELKPQILNHGSINSLVSSGGNVEICGISMGAQKKRKLKHAEMNNPSAKKLQLSTLQFNWS